MRRVHLRVVAAPSFTHVGMLVGRGVVGVSVL